MSEWAVACESVAVVRGKRRVVDDVSFSVRRGEMVALVGPNGAGKSSLIEAIAGANVQVAGRICLGGHATSELSLQERAKLLALVGRESASSRYLSVRSMVALGRHPHQAGRSTQEVDRTIVEEALRETDCESLAERPLYALSDGERQRAYFARALAQKPKVLLLDEATAHLDLSHRERSFLRARRFADEGGTVLAVAHDLDLTLRHATRVLVMHQGRLVTDGAAEEALSPQLLRQIFEVDAEVVTFPGGKHLRVHGVI